MSTPFNSLPPDVVDAIQRNNLIEAIKLLRKSTGLGLKEAKDLIDAHQQGKPLPNANVRTAGGLPANVMEALQRGDKIGAIKLLRQQTGLELKDAKDAVEGSSSGFPSGSAPDSLPTSNGLAPGEVPRSGKAFPWVAVLIGIALVGYYLLKRGA
ncbi:MAG: ribosomal protein L7/L12 [Burkholderiales bacterium]|nr:ribosomal protein L7/L12 [Burkholderiales bacterium]